MKETETTRNSRHTDPDHRVATDRDRAKHSGGYARQHIWHRPGTQMEICLPRHLQKNSKTIYSAASASEDIFVYLALYK